MQRNGIQRILQSSESFFPNCLKILQHFQYFPFAQLYILEDQQIFVGSIGSLECSYASNCLSNLNNLQADTNLLTLSCQSFLLNGFFQEAQALLCDNQLFHLEHIHNNNSNYNNLLFHVSILLKHNISNLNLFCIFFCLRRRFPPLP